MTAHAELVRFEADDTSRLAEEVQDDESLYRSLTTSAAEMELAAQDYDSAADKYLAAYGDADVFDDDDADGL